MPACRAAFTFVASILSFTVAQVNSNPFLH